MAIVASDIQFRLSGGAANTNPDASLGGAISSTAAGTNIFDNVTSAEATSGDTEYRCIYVRNGVTSAALTLVGAKIWIQSPDGSGGAYAGDTITIGLGTSGVNGTEQNVTTFSPIGTEATAPVGVTFYAAATEGAALVMGDLPQNQHHAVWIKRVIAGGAAAFSNAGFTLRVKGDTAA
jgi:hypothetical protein